MTPEKKIQNDIRRALQDQAVIFRANVGTFKTVDGRFIDAGLPKGFTDLFGFRKSDGKIFFIEIKTDKGRLSKEQILFGKACMNYPVLYGVARSVEEAKSIILSDS